jgi:hypothetical protein
MALARGTSGMAGMGASAGSMFAGLGGSPAAGLAGLGASYQSAYQNALQQNQDRYGQIMSGYGNALKAQGAGGQNILKGYRDLQSQVLGGLEGVEQSRLNEINDYYTSQGGLALSRLAGGMMGNTGVRQSALRGLMADQSKAETLLAGQMAQMRGDYQSQFGMAAQGFRQQNLRDTQGLRLNRLDFLNSIQSPYPDAGAYMQLASMYGNQMQAERDRADMMRLYEDQNALAGGPGVSPGTPGPAGLGYNPRPAPGYSSADFSGGGMPNSGASLYSPWASGGAGSAWGASRAELVPPSSPAYTGLQAFGGGGPIFGGGGGNALGAAAGPAAYLGGYDAGGYADPALMASGASILGGAMGAVSPLAGGLFGPALQAVGGLYGGL